MGKGSSKIVRHAYKGEGADTFTYVRTKVAFCTCFLILAYARYSYHTFLSLESTFIIVF